MTFLPAPPDPAVPHDPDAQLHAARPATTTAPGSGATALTRLQQWQAEDAGMSTAEYAVGTVAACGFAGVLYRLLTSDTVTGLLGKLIERALTAIF